MLSNTYTQEWFRLFADATSREQTEREITFIHSLLNPSARVLDLACGFGRHATLLRSLGHEVIGVDRSQTALDTARSRDQAVAWVQADMRRLPFRSGSVDAVVSLWQSFGYFDSETNATVLEQLRDLLNTEGILVIDVYHRHFFEQHQGERRVKRGDIDVMEMKTVRDGRLRVELAYEQLATGDRFDWQLFSPEEFHALAEKCGLRVVHACSQFDLSQPPTAHLPRVQYVVRRAW